MSNSSEIQDGYHTLEINKTVWQIPERYTKLKLIGTGAYGQVCSALERELNTNVAIKKLSRPFQTTLHAKRAYREIRILKHMNHENVLGLLDIFSPTTTLDKFQELYLVTQLMGPDLYKVVKSHQVDDAKIQIWIYQILRGLKYIHSAGIIHRDLKPSNIAVTPDNDLKILDFGLARQADTEMTGYVATRWYRAPEVLFNWTHYTKTVDIWSVGCILAELNRGKPLFRGKDYMDQLTEIMSLVGTPKPDLILKMTSKDAKVYINSLKRKEKKDFQKEFADTNPLAIDLLERMLELDPDVRITAEEALAHAYMATYYDPSDEPVCEPLDQTIEDSELPVDEWKRLIYLEVNSFVRPPPEDSS